MLEPAEPARAWEAVGVAALASSALLGAARLRRARCAAAGRGARRARGGRARAARRRPRRRVPAAGPLGRRCSSGVGRGIDALPGVRVPYRGVDEWTRLAIGAGGAAARRCSPRCSRSGRGATRTGFPAAALLALVTLYAVPAVVLNFDGEFLRGALLALLMVAFLRLEKLRVRDAPAAGARRRSAAARRADRRAGARRRRSVVRLRELGRRDGRRRKAVAFSWDHDYGPLDWPRDGRELLRVQGAPAGVLEGARPRRSSTGAAGARTRAQRGEDPAAQLPASPAQRRALDPAASRSRSATCARTASSPRAITTSIDGEDSYPIGGGVFNAPDGLGRGDSYTARSTRRGPTERQLREDSDGTTRTGCGRYLDDLHRRAEPRGRRPTGRAQRAASRSPGRSGASRHRGRRALRPVDSTASAAAGARGQRPGAHLARSPQRLKRRTPTTPFEYVARVEALPRRRLRLLRDAAAPRRARSTASCSTPRSASASSSPAPRRCCCGWAASRRAWRPASRRAPSTNAARVRRARPRRALVGRGLVPRHTAGSRATRRPPPRRRARSRATSASGGTPGGARRACRASAASA